MNWTQWRSGANLVEAAVRVDSFKSWVQSQTFAYVTLDQLPLYRPLFRRLCITKPFAESVDEDETGYVFGLGARIKPDNQTAIGVPHKHIRPRLTSGT
jgi:opacity protein-like surface antigen